MAELFEGSEAPDFELPSLQRGQVKLSDFRGKKNVILFFYLKDDAPACTQEALSFSNRVSDFEKRDAVVIGVSYDDLESHRAYAAKHDLKIDLLCDLEQKVSKAYGTYSQKGVYITDPEKLKDKFKQAHGMIRVSFAIDKEGKIVKIFGHVKPDGHADEAIRILDKMLGNQAA